MPLRDSRSFAEALSTSMQAGPPSAAQEGGANKRPKSTEIITSAPESDVVAEPEGPVVARACDHSAPTARAVRGEESGAQSPDRDAGDDTTTNVREGFAVRGARAARAKPTTKNVVKPMADLQRLNVVKRMVDLQRSCREKQLEPKWLE
eukprot:CAMPEP_0117474432 /NCGR_PEP_ID=MMETSP0784-20121206/9281_1 /TAXON_ID=39447 /ORGANISM="" /LENGTH=148 /DNA_ID=CAMNT_0005268657 /DNA_START=235 /DNA_END=678 /DNA_ORIENTATION=+